MLHFFVTYRLIFFKKVYYHIVMIINSKLEVDHDILKNIPSQNRPNRILYIAHVTAKLRCSAVMVLAKLHHKVCCLKWPKTTPNHTVNPLNYGCCFLG